MPPNLPRDAIVIAFDVGKSVSTSQSYEYEEDYEEKSFFTQSRDCVSWIIQRKIISQSTDVLSLLLFGSKEKDDSVGSENYKNIKVKFDFQLASWEMLKFIKKKLKSTDIESDWLKALTVSVNMLEVYEKFNNVQDKKIVIFSDFTQPASADLDNVIEHIEALNIEVTIIGPNHLHFSYDCDDADESTSKRKRLDISQESQVGERTVNNLWKKLPENIVMCTFESALKQLGSYIPKNKRINYWNCLMDIGDVKINISMVKKTDVKPPRKFNFKCLKPDEQGPSQIISGETAMVRSEETAPIMRDTVMHYKHEPGKNEDFVDVEVKAEDTIEGFRYGATIIPFSEEDKAAMEYRAGPKSFSVICFTHISNVPYYLLCGECSFLVVPRIKDTNAEVALSAIIQGMKKMECLAIVRRVYSDDCGVSLGILYPTIEEIFCDETNDVSYREYLLFVELAFEDDVRTIDFPSLEEVAKHISQKQYDVIDNLIDSMNLMKADRELKGEPCEAFDLPFLHDIKEQFFHYCVVQRGLNPNEPLPSSLPSYIKKFTEVPKSVQENCKSVFKEIKHHFKIKKSSDNNKDKDVQCDQNTTSDQSHKRTGKDLQKRFDHFQNSEIQGQNPAMRTWMILFQKGFPTVVELEELFIKLINLDEPEKSETLKCFGIVITRLRAMYSTHKNPDAYNRWMVSFKQYLNGNDGIFSELWEVIVNEYAGLITKEENPCSTATDKEVEEFLCVDIAKTLPLQSERPAFEFLDQLQKEQMDLDTSLF